MAGGDREGRDGGGGGEGIEGRGGGKDRGGSEECTKRRKGRLEEVAEEVRGKEVNRKERTRVCRVGVVGPKAAGKSALITAFLGQERAGGRGAPPG